jgi:hypothetical protein
MILVLNTDQNYVKGNTSLKIRNNTLVNWLIAYSRRLTSKDDKISFACLDHNKYRTNYHEQMMHTNQKLRFEILNACNVWKVWSALYAANSTCKIPKPMHPQRADFDHLLHTLGLTKFWWHVSFLHSQNWGVGEQEMDHRRKNHHVPPLATMKIN